MKERIIKLLNTPKHQLHTAEEIYQLLELTTEDEYDELGLALEELEKDFIITHNKQNAFAMLGYFQLAKGKIIIKDGGYGFVDGELFNVHIGKGKTLTALSGDLVLVRFYEYNGTNYEGEVVRVIERKWTEVVGTLIKRRNKYFVRLMLDKNLVWGNVKKHGTVKSNSVVKINITKYYDYNNVEAEIVESYGNADLPGMDITMQVIQSGIKYEFEEETIDEARQVPQTISKDDYPDRRDLTNELIITIDGDDARDFDDAVTVTKLDNGNYLLKVCIADVTEYVTENSFLDIEAYERGTSVYLPDRVIPMLPFELSNGICSLNEDVERLVMVAEIELDENCNIVNTDHYEAVMKSKHRMTYTNVNKILEEDNTQLIEQYNDIYDMLKMMQEIAAKLYDIRIKRGSFDFETTEAKLELDEYGNVTSINIRERRTAEKLIEEFMLLANESVAEKMTWLDVPFIYRVHDEPNEERLNLFLNRLRTMKQEFSYKNKSALPKALQQFLLNTNDESNDIEKTLKTVISNTLLRTMSKAKYQEVNIGHYGLASKCYTHFTSPIRRYPDLLVHRLMKEFLFNKPQTSYENAYDYFTKKVIDTGITSSAREKTAENLERNTVDMKKCQYMERFIGKTFTGMISSVVNWGLYVTLDNTVEGLVRFDDLPYDYYEVDETAGIIYGKKKNNVYRLGDIVKVRLEDINSEKHQTSFRLLGKVQ